MQIDPGNLAVNVNLRTVRDIPPDICHETWKRNRPYRGKFSTSKQKYFSHMTLVII
jgi:hypothetical protein